MTQDHLRAIDALINAFYAVFDNRNGMPDFKHLDSLLLNSVMIHKRDSGGGLESMNKESFIAPRKALFDRGELVDFHEFEINHDTHITLGVASRRSHYAKKGFLQGEAINATGHKHFMLVEVDGTWKIAAMVWEDD